MIAPCRVYVAAPFSEWRLVREVQGEIRRRGGEITCDWTLEADKYPTGGDADTPEAEAIGYALADLQGVNDADAFLLLTTEDKTKGMGCYIELGFALATRASLTSDIEPLSDALRNKFYRIAICGPQRERSVFNRLGKRFANWQDALPYLVP